MPQEDRAGSADDRFGQIAMFDALSKANSAERVQLVLDYLESHPQGPLDLGSDADRVANLSGVDLSRATLAAGYVGNTVVPSWWDAERGTLQLRMANLRGANLRSANLEGCDLRGADLRDALLGDACLDNVDFEGAILSDADLAGTTLQNANLAGANLENTLLEEANLQGTVLRFVLLRGAVLEGANLQDADLWGATLDKANMVGADLRRAILRETSLIGTNLTGSRLGNVDAGKARLQEANLTDTDLREATLTGVCLDGAILRGARLQGLDLSTCTLTHVHLSGTWLDGTRLDQAQLGGAIGEELAQDYRAARTGYLGLEHTFERAGDPDAISWAYRKRRRMQKLEARANALRALQTHNLAAVTKHGLRYATDLGAEWLCDYGESIPRVLGTMTLVYLLFTVLYGITGSVVRVGSTPTGSTHPTTALLDLAVFSLLAMTTSGSPVVGLLPQSEAVHLLTGLEALCGIFLTGLLGFVVGNRLRR